MPNWCNNVVEVSHKDPAKLKALVEAYNDARFCSYAIPVPASLQIVAGCVSDEAEQKKLEEDTARNLEVHGYGNWYDFCVNEWGTKWDCGGDGDRVELDEGQDNTTFDFTSAWAPPVGVYAALAEQGFTVRAYYHEPGMCFAGIWDDGVEDFYELNEMNSDEVADTIPSVLDEMFCISEDMAMWEAENSEEDEVQEWYEEGVEKKGLTPHKS